jgi:RNA polymerase sigma factor (sigma-70 family)
MLKLQEFHKPSERIFRSIMKTAVFAVFLQERILQKRLKQRENTSGLSDLELANGYQVSGEKDFVGELFRRYSRFVFLVCMKYLKDEEKAKDAGMQIFENLFSELKKHEVRNFKSWLHSVARNHCLMQLRSRKQSRIMEEEMQKDFAAGMESAVFLHPVDETESSLTNLEAAVLLLSKEQRLCIELFYLRKMSYNEIVQLTGKSYDQVKSNIQNGKRSLKILLSGQNEQ